MVEPFVWRFKGGGLDGLKKDDGNETGRYLRAYLRATFDEAAATDNQFDRLGASITAALSPFPDYLDFVQQQNMRCQKSVGNEGLDPVLATIIRLVIEGRWLAKVFEVMALEPLMKRRVVGQLIAWTQGDPTN